MWTHERELPLWLVFGFEEARLAAEVEAADRAARAAAAAQSLGELVASASRQPRGTRLTLGMSSTARQNKYRHSVADRFCFTVGSTLRPLG